MRLDLVLHLPPIWGGGVRMLHFATPSSPTRPHSPSRCNHWLVCVGAPVGWCIMGIH